eukprot:scaffold977_cov253-Pinguiococcus_pyrenoidosus.AAC.18
MDVWIAHHVQEAKPKLSQRCLVGPNEAEAIGIMRRHVFGARDPVDVERQAALWLGLDVQKGLDRHVADGGVPQPSKPEPTNERHPLISKFPSLLADHPGRGCASLSFENDDVPMQPSVCVFPEESDALISQLAAGGAEGVEEHVKRDFDEVGLEERREGLRVRRRHVRVAMWHVDRLRILSRLREHCADVPAFEGAVCARAATSRRGGGGAAERVLVLGGRRPLRRQRFSSKVTIPLLAEALSDAQSRAQTGHPFPRRRRIVRTQQRICSAWVVPTAPCRRVSELLVVCKVR